LLFAWLPSLARTRNATLNVFSSNWIWCVSDLLIMKEVMQGAAQRAIPRPSASRTTHACRDQTTNAGRSYEICRAPGRNGAQKEELMKNCGITTHEAELLVRLHGRSTLPAQAPAAESR